MKPLYFLAQLLLVYLLMACSLPDNATDSGTTNSPVVYGAFENAVNKPSAEISHEDNWTIVSTLEKGDRVYWFLAPDRDKTTPALFKKTIRVKGKHEQETETVSECEAPKQICDDLMKQFKTLSEKYK